MNYTFIYITVHIIIIETLTNEVNMEDTTYNKLFDDILELNKEEGNSFVIGIRDSNWVKPRDKSVPGYSCHVIIRNGEDLVFENSYTSSDVEEIESSLNVLLEEANEALTQYIKK